MMVEFGTPLFTSFRRAREDYGRAINTEPLVAEWAAAYFGAEAYRLESAAYRRAIRDRFRDGQSYTSRRWGSPDSGRALLDDPAFLAVQKLFIANTWQSWRTWGISGGMVPWERANEHLELVNPWTGPSRPWHRDRRRRPPGPRDHRARQGPLLPDRPHALRPHRPAAQRAGG